MYGNIQIEWFRQFLPLLNGIPCIDTFRRVLRVLNPKQLERVFSEISEEIRESLGSPINHIAVDGKTVRGSYDGEEKAIHCVSALCTTEGIILGHVKTEEKSNEITAIPDLLDSITIKGSTVSIDAMGCQKAIAEQIINQKGDYYLSLKLNQPLLYQAVESVAKKYLEGYSSGTENSYYETTDNDHGRLEVRKHWSFCASELETDEFHDVWKGLKSIGIIERNVENKGKQTSTYSYYISSRAPDAQELAKTIRSHWSIESFHWILDVHFKEDASRIRKDHGPENMAIIRRFAYNLVKKATPEKQTFKGTRVKALLKAQYLENILLGKTT